MSKTHTSGRLSGPQVKAVFMFLVVISIASIALSAEALGEVSYYTVSPSDPTQGDNVVISGKADPNEEISVYVTFEDIAETDNGAYSYPVDDISIPDGTKHFDLVAEGVSDLDIKVKIPLTSYYVSMNQLHPGLITVSDNVATFGTSSIDSGTYSIIMEGTAPGDEVSIYIKARLMITADDEGYFKYNYDTENLPAGKYTITIDRANQQVTVHDDGSDDGNDSSDSDDDSDNSSATSKKSHGGSNTGTEFKIVPADSLGKEETGETASSSSSGDSSLASTQESDNSDSQTVEGSKLEKQTETQSTATNIKIIGIVIVAIGLIGLGAIMYRKKSA